MAINKMPIDASFDTPANAIVGKIYHIRGFYRGCQFRLLEVGDKYAVLTEPRHPRKLIALQNK